MLSTSIPTGALNPSGLTSDQITALVNVLPEGVSHQSARFRLLDQSFNPVSLPWEGITGDTADISRWVATGKCTMNTTQAVHRSLDLTLNEIQGFDFDSLHQLIEMRWMYTDPWGGFLFEVPVGVFQFILADRALSDAGNVWTITGLDLISRIAQINFLNNWTATAGTTFTDVVTQMLTCGVLPVSQGGTGVGPDGSDMVGPGFSTSQLNITPSSLTLAEDVTWTRQDSMLTAINQLLGAINYWPLYCTYNINGTPTLESVPEPYLTDALPASSWTYATGQTALQPGIKQQVTNQATIGNVAVVESSSASNDAFVSIKYNTSPSSVISIPNMGRPIVIYQSDSTIPDQPTCDLAAYLLLQEAALASESVQFVTPVNPFHQVHDYYLVNVNSKDGRPEITSNPNTLFVESQWDIDVVTKVQTHTGSRSVLL